MTHRLIVVLVILLVSVAKAEAQPGDATAFTLLRMESSGRVAGLAGAAVALDASDVSTAFQNPALVGAAMEGMLSATYLNHLTDVKAGFVSYAVSGGKLGTVVGGLRYLTYGTFERADANGVKDGTTFGAYDAIVTLGLGRVHGESLHYGASIHWVNARIDDASAGAFAADAGVYYYMEGEQTGLSLSLHNVGVTVNSFGETGDDLPLDLRVGISKRLTHLPLHLTLMGYNLHDFGGSEGSIADDVLEHIAIGGEFILGPAFRLRVGYNHRRHQDLKTDSRLDLAGIGLGFGLNVNRFGFDYAYNDWSSLGGIHHLTVQTRI